MLLSRRKFVQSLLAFAASGAAPSAFAASLKETTSKPLSRLYIAGSEFSVCVIDLQTGKLLKRHELGFSPHAFVRSPLTPHKIWMVQRYTTFTASTKPVTQGRSVFKAAELDLDKGKVTNEIHSELGSEYRGHALFAPDGKTLFITRVDLDKAEGFLTGYDTTSHASKVVADYPLGKTGLHDCRLAADKRTAHVVTTGAANMTPYADKPSYKRYSRGGISCVDIATGKISSRMEIMDDDYHPGHFRILDDGRIFVTCSTDEPTKTSGGIFWGHTDENTLKMIDLPQNDKPTPRSEKFDIAVNEKRQIAAVNDNIRNEIYLIDIQNGKFLEKIPYSSCGVTYNPYEDTFVVHGDVITLLDQKLKRVIGKNPDFSGMRSSFKAGHSFII